MKKKILLVDDDGLSRLSIKKLLNLSNFEVLEAENGAQALEVLTDVDSHCDAIVSDIRMPVMDGLALFKRVQGFKKRIPFILMTAYGDVDHAVWAMKMGAVDFIQKPFKRDQLLKSLEMAFQLNFSSKQTKIVGSSKELIFVHELMQEFAPTHSIILITGESGVGKELVARQIHQMSTRSKSPFVTINCAAIPETLIEAELFGYKKGAFTGADRERKGLFVEANNGTIFLDEIGDLPLALQSKLLRVLQDGEVRQIGSSGIQKVNVRTIAATNVSLRDKVLEGKFREDLFYRLDVFHIPVPPLRERKGDIQELTFHFIKTFNSEYKKEIRSISKEALHRLCCYSWPGNIRELKNVIERAVVLEKGFELQVQSLPTHIRAVLDSGFQDNFFKEREVGNSVSIPIGMPLKQVEDIMIQKALEASDGDKLKAAKLLGVNSRTIYRRLERLDKKD